jgi:hypothetical protein
MSQSHPSPNKIFLLPLQIKHKNTRYVRLTVASRLQTNRSRDVTYAIVRNSDGLFTHLLILVNKSTIIRFAHHLLVCPKIVTTKFYVVAGM